MAVESDAKLADLAAEILRAAVQVYDQGDLSKPEGDRYPVRAAGEMGTFSLGTDLAGSFAADWGGRGAAGVSLKEEFRLPDQLPAVRLAATAVLARQARSVPLIASLQALSGWLGPDGRLVTQTDELSAADAADAASQLGISPASLPYLWEYALTSGWFELEDERGGGRSWAVPGETARRWAESDDSGALHVWAVLFAAVLACSLTVAASADPDAARRLNLAGQGAAVGVRLFLGRRAGLSAADVTRLFIDGAVGDPPSSRARRAWEAWVHEHGDPARVLLGELAAVGAVTVPETGAGMVVLTQLALWALREQLQRDGVDVALIPESLAEMSAADLIALAEGVSQAELEAESAAWVTARGPEVAARELLAVAAGGGAAERLAAVNLTRRIGVAAYDAWRAAIARPELRGYARIALSVLAGELPGTTLPLVLEPSPDDVTWVATDLLALACGDENPDPAQVAAQFREAVPPGEESWIFDLMSRSSHPDVVQVLTALGHHHPDRRIARDAKRAAHIAARSRTGARSEIIPVRSAGH
jgi:hypothetical protein